MWGYKEVYVPNHPKARVNGCVLEHRYVVEQSIGRLLNDEEVVHHIDENRSNNELSNLIVFIDGKNHNRFHETGIMKRLEDGRYISPKQFKSCKICNKEFYSAKKKVEHCSHECSRISARKTDRPSKEELIKLLKEGSFTIVGKKYGVSDSAIRKWCDNYGLPRKIKQIREF